MAKGLFSWLGFGKKSKEEKQEIENLKKQEQNLELVNTDKSIEKNKDQSIVDEVQKAAAETVSEGKKELADGDKIQETAAETVSEGRKEQTDGDKIQETAAETVSEGRKEQTDADKIQETAAETVSEGRKEQADGDKIQETAAETVSEGKKEHADADKIQETAAETVSEGRKEQTDGDKIQETAAETVSEGRKEQADGDKIQEIEAETVSEGKKEQADADKIQETAAETVSEGKKEQADGDEIQKTAEQNVERDKAKIADSKDETALKVKKSFFERLKKTRDNLAYGLSALIIGKKIDDELYEDLETALLTADLGVETTEYVIEKLKEESKARDLHDAIALKANLKKILTEILKPCEVPLCVEKKGNMPFVILMVGVNGAGKTTTIGKLALKFKEQGLKVMLGAGDTFRAAAVEQLKEWGKRTDVPVISQPTGSDSASVLFDALSSAKSKNVDVLICDTAGRLQNKENLMEELKKIVRVMKKISEDVPHEVLLVLDSTTGQNAVSQMKLFSDAVQVTGLCLTKLDGSAKGGVIFALADKFKIPVRFVGIGEKTEDLRVFDVDNFVDALIGDNL